MLQYKNEQLPKKCLSVKEKENKKERAQEERDRLNSFVAVNAVNANNIVLSLIHLLGLLYALNTKQTPTSSVQRQEQLGKPDEIVLSDSPCSEGEKKQDREEEKKVELNTQIDDEEGGNATEEEETTIFTDESLVIKLIVQEARTLFLLRKNSLSVPSILRGPLA